MEKKIYLCKTCGISLHNRADWCYLGCGNDYNEMVEVKGSTEFINEIRQDTLRQVLPVIKTHKEGEGDYCDTGEDMDWACRSNCVELAVERLINKAKELWGLDLTNLN